jgi:hypothetical protein
MTFLSTQAASYSSSPNSIPFLAYFEATTPASPAKHARLRTALFLQTSSTYDASAAQARLAPHASLLAPELAILAGKVGKKKHLKPLISRVPRLYADFFFFGTAVGQRSRSSLAPRANYARPHVRSGILHVPRCGSAPTSRHTARRARGPRPLGATVSVYHRSSDG